MGVNYVIGDIISRYHKLKGDDYTSMGWDAFGLPAENAMIQFHTLKIGPNPILKI